MHNVNVNSIGKKYAVIEQNLKITVPGTCTVDIYLILFVYVASINRRPWSVFDVYI